MRAVSCPFNRVTCFAGTDLGLATASADQSGADPLMAAGISEVVHRPLVSDELASALARCLTASPVSADELQT